MQPIITRRSVWFQSQSKATPGPTARGMTDVMVCVAGSSTVSVDAPASSTNDIDPSWLMHVSEGAMPMGIVPASTGAWIPRLSSPTRSSGTARRPSPCRREMLKKDGAFETGRRFLFSRFILGPLPTVR